MNVPSESMMADVSYVLNENYVSKKDDLNAKICRI